MRVNALLVDGLDLEGRDAFVLLEGEGDVADEVLDENGVVIGLHGNVAFVGALEQGIDGRGGTGLGDGDEFLDPDEFPASGLFLLGPHLNGDMPPLVVGAVVTDLFAARAERFDRHLHPQGEDVLFAVGLPEEGDLAAHLGPGTGDRGGFLDEIRKLDLDMGALSIQSLFEIVEDLRQRAHGDLTLMAGEDLQKATHVGALKMMGQVDRHRDRRHCGQRFTLAVHNLYGILKIRDANLIDRNPPCVPRFLNVWQRDCF
jgi:hypothetical protein